MKFKNKYLNEIFKIVIIIVGVIFMGFAFNSFFYANNIAPGGFGGLAAVISDLFVKLNWFYISPTILYLILNAFLIFFLSMATPPEFRVHSPTSNRKMVFRTLSPLYQQFSISSLIISTYLFAFAIS